MNVKMSVFAGCIFAGFAGLCLIFPPPKEYLRRNDAELILQKASSEEKWFLSNLCKEVICESALGYTLFGDKPMSSTTFRGPRINRRFFFRTIALPLVQKYANMLHSHNFFFTIEENSYGPILYIVNKKAFLAAVSQNIAIFRSILGENTTPSHLLNTIESKKYSIETALKGSHTLYGILYGFGVDNAKRFARRQQIEDHESLSCTPPWRGCMDSSETMLEDWVSMYLNKKNILEKSERNNYFYRDSPALPFTSFTEEKADLNKRLTFVYKDLCPPGRLLIVDLPGFVGDLDSDETKEFRKKYMKLNILLKNLVEDDDFLQKVLKVFFEE